MSSTRYCKFHVCEGESEHWAILDQRAFASKDARPHYTSDTLIIPKHLKLELHFDWTLELVQGTTKYDLVILTDDADEIRLDAVNLKVFQVKLGGQKLDFDNNGAELIVPLNKSLRKGSSLKLSIDHAVEKPQAGIYFTQPDKNYPSRFKTVWTQGQDEDSRYYFPCFDKPNYKQTTEVILHLPPEMFGLSNGRLINTKKTKKESFYHYKMEIPYSTYLISIVGGDFSETKDKWKNTIVKWYVEKGKEKEGHNAFRDTSDIIRFFSDYTGYPYPYPHYTQIAVPEFIFGGMENFTVTTQTDLTLHDERASIDMDSNGLVAHEAAHMWFGDIVTAKSWAHAWLHESFATYFDALYTRESKGENEFRYQLLEESETYFAEDAKYRRPIVTNIYKEPIDLFDAHLYPGGALRLHHLKNIAGENIFRKAIAVFLKRHEFGLVETIDFMRCLEEESARNFDSWAHQWIYRGGYPSLELEFQWNEKFKLATICINQMQKSGSKEEYLLFDLKLNIAFYYRNSSELFPVSIEKKSEKFTFRLKGKPLFFRLDPEYECPCKKVKLNISRPMLRKQLEHAPDPIGRIEAAKMMARKASKEDVDLLSKRLLKESFWGVVERIASTLGEIGGNQARDALIKGLKHSQPKVRRGIIIALGRFKNDETTAIALRKIAKGDDSYRVEAAALRCLGKIKDTASREFLEQTFNRSSHNDIAQSAILDALAELEDERSWGFLVRNADYGAPQLSRSSAMRAIAMIVKRYPHRKKEALDLLTRFATETPGSQASAFRGKLGAIKAIQALEDLAGIPALRKSAENEADGRLRRRAEDAIATLRDLAKKPKEIEEIRSDLDDVIKENKSLKEKFDFFEQKDKAKKSSRKKGN